MSGGNDPIDTPPGASNPTPSGPGTTLADRIGYLFARVHPRGRGEYTLEEVTSGMRERRGVSITSAYLSQLRNGQRTNPSREVLEGLADFFGVNPSYFSDDEVAESTAAELELYTVLQDAEVRHIAQRAAGLSPQSLRALAVIIEHWRQLEGRGGRQDEDRIPPGQPPSGTGQTE